MPGGTKETIRQYALQLGFNDCRFAAANPPESGAAFQKWLDAGFHGEMGYLARQASKRLLPDQVLPGVRSLIVVSASYFNQVIEDQLATGQPDCGFVARYACFQDYHTVMGEALRKILIHVEQLAGPSHKSLWYVDTGPILEREYAQRAGLGFIGKHTNLISRKQGNWIFLAAVLTTLELEPDPPESNRCGTCTRCMEACPTQAIRSPFVLDARRCISYLTIELKGPIPEEFRPAIGRRIFGCDDCLAVCPWNRFAAEGRLMRDHLRADLACPDLLSLLSLDEPGFQAKFSGTPIERTKLRGLKRNVCVALGNTGTPEALPALEKAVREEGPLVAEHARWAIERIRLGAEKAQKPKGMETWS